MRKNKRIGYNTLFYIYILMRKKANGGWDANGKKREKKLKKIVDNQKNLLYNANEKGKGVFET